MLTVARYAREDERRSFWKEILSLAGGRQPNRKGENHRLQGPALG